jgi:hypothetical protein
MVFMLPVGRLKNNARSTLNQKSGETRKGGKTMQYTKPVIVAQNNKQGSFAAGCPEKNRGPADRGEYSCINCERTK